MKHCETGFSEDSSNAGCQSIYSNICSLGNLWYLHFRVYISLHLICLPNSVWCSLLHCIYSVCSAYFPETSNSINSFITTGVFEKKKCKTRCWRLVRDNLFWRREKARAEPGPSVSDCTLWLNKPDLAGSDSLVKARVVWREALWLRWCVTPSTALDVTLSFAALYWKFSYLYFLPS